MLEMMFDCPISFPGATAAAAGCSVFLLVPVLTDVANCECERGGAEPPPLPPTPGSAPLHHVAMATLLAAAVL